MNIMAAIVPTLLALMALCMLALRQDARQRRIDRQLASAMATWEPTAADWTAAQPVRLGLARSKARNFVLRALLDYRHDAPRQWPLAYTAAVGLGLAAATFLLGGLMYPLWVVGPAAVVEGCLAVRLVFGWQRRRYASQVLQQLPDATELIISSVRAGLPVSEAFNIIANEMPEPTSSEFRRVIGELGLGRSAGESLRVISDRTGVTEYAILSVTLEVQSKSGGRLAQTLQILGDAIRQRIALAGRAKALAAEARLSARVLASLPLLSCVVMYIERPDSFLMLFKDPRGQALFGFGMLSLALGILTMRRMIRKGTTV